MSLHSFFSPLSLFMDLILVCSSWKSVLLFCDFLDMKYRQVYYEGELTVKCFMSCKKTREDLYVGQEKDFWYSTNKDSELLPIYCCAQSYRPQASKMFDTFYLISETEPWPWCVKILILMHWRCCFEWILECWPYLTHWMLPVNQY